MNVGERLNEDGGRFFRGFAEQLSKNEGQSDSVERFCIRN